MTETTPKQHDDLLIQRLPDGGFVVSDRQYGEDRFTIRPPFLFAATSMTEALDYIRSKMGQDR